MGAPAFYQKESRIYQLINADCLEAMRQMPECSVDACVTDPPYGLKFMGKRWDDPGSFVERRPDRETKFDRIGGNHNPCNPQDAARTAGVENRRQQAWHEAWAREAIRVLKPGGYLLAFGGTRTYHRLACAIEDAGFEIRDTLQWIYATGFPKSLNVSKQIDKMNGKHLVDLSLFGSYVKEQRLAKGLSLRELDECMETNTAASWWEGRKSGVQLPSLVTYRRLKEVLELDNRFDELIQWAEAEREVVGQMTKARSVDSKSALPTVGAAVKYETWDETTPATEPAKQWEGWGTALKPAHEPIVMARKPLSESSIARQVLKTGTGAINVDACRVGVGEDVPGGGGWTGTGRHEGYQRPAHANGKPTEAHSKGRWPANLLLSHSPGCQRIGSKRVKPSNGSGRVVSESKQSTVNTYGEYGSRPDVAGFTHLDPDGMEEVESWECVEGCPVALLDLQSGTSKSPKPYKYNGKPSGGFTNNDIGQGIGHNKEFGDSGGASRFFSQFHEPDTGPGFLYQAKSSRAERNDFTKSLPRTKNKRKRYQQDLSKRWCARVKNLHPTVKPLGLCDWLVKLVCPPGGVVLDPFMGSGSIGCSAVRQGFNFIGIDQEAEYATIARRRLKHHAAEIEKVKTERLFA